MTERSRTMVLTKFEIPNRVTGDLVVAVVGVFADGCDREAALALVDGHDDPGTHHINDSITLLFRGGLVIAIEVRGCEGDPSLEDGAMHELAFLVSEGAPLFWTDRSGDGGWTLSSLERP